MSKKKFVKLSELQDKFEEKEKAKAVYEGAIQRAERALMPNEPNDLNEINDLLHQVNGRCPSCGSAKWVFYTFSLPGYCGNPIAHCTTNECPSFFIHKDV